MTLKKHAKSKDPDDGDLVWQLSPDHFWKIDFGELAFGLCLIIFGLLYLAKNLGWLPIEMNFSFVQLWPLLIIFWGLSLISGRGWMAILAGAILTFTVLIIASVLLSQQMVIRLEPELTQIPMWQNQVSPVNLIKDYPVAFEADPAIKELHLSIDNQLGSIELSGNSSKLLDGSLKSNFSELLINSQSGLNSKTIVLNSFTKASKLGQSQSLLDLHINNNTPVNIELANGAAPTSALLQDIWLSNLTINSKSSVLDLALGQKAEVQNIKLNGRYQQINPSLPKDTSIFITGIKTALDGFNLSATGLKSSSPAPTKKIINIDFETESTNITVTWY